MAKTGRPTDYTPELAAEICSRLAIGDSMRTVCRADDMPNRATVFKWLALHPEFNDQYGIAKESAGECVAEEMFDIADDANNDWMEKLDKDEQSIGWQLNGEHIQRSKLRVDIRKWYLSKIKPKKYGDKIALGNDPDNPLTTLIKDISGKTLEPNE